MCANLNIAQFLSDFVVCEESCFCRSKFFFFDKERKFLTILWSFLTSAFLTSFVQHDEIKYVELRTFLNCEIL